MPRKCSKHFKPCLNVSNPENSCDTQDPAHAGHTHISSGWRVLAFKIQILQASRARKETFARLKQEQTTRNQKGFDMYEKLKTFAGCAWKNSVTTSLAFNTSTTYSMRHALPSLRLMMDAAVLQTRATPVGMCLQFELECPDSEFVAANAAVAKDALQPAGTAKP